MLSYVVMSFVFPLWIIFLSQNDHLLSHFFSQLIWTTPGFVSNMICFVFLKLIRNRTINTLNSVSIYLNRVEPFPNILAKIFKSWHHVVITLPFVFFSIIFQIKYLIFTPWTSWLPWYQASHTLASLYAIATTLDTAFFYFLTFMLGYFCVSSCFLLYKIGSVMKEEIEVSKVESLNLRSVGRLSLLLSISWAITLGPSLILLVVAPLTWWSLIQVVGFSISSLFLFIYPTFSTHQLLVKIKEQAQERIKTKIWDEYSRMTCSPSELNNIQRIVLQLQALRIYEERINKISTWPFETTVLIKLTSAFFLPIVPVAIKLALESFLQ